MKADGATHVLNGVEQGAFARRGHDDGNANFPACQVFQQFRAIHGGHFQIDDQKIGRGCEHIEYRQRLLPVASLVDSGDAEFSAQFGRMHALRRAIVDDERRGDDLHDGA